MNRPVSLNEVSAGAASAEWKLLRDFSERDVAAWRDLQGRVLEPNVFLEPDFALAAAKMRGGNTGAVLVRDGSRLIGLFPGELEGVSAGRAVSTFVLWTHPFAPLSTPLADRDAAHIAMAKFFEFLPSVPATPKLALLPLLNESGEFARIAGDVFHRGGRILRRFGEHERAVLAPSKGDALALPGKKLKELRRQRRRLEEEGMLVHETVGDATSIGKAVSNYLALEEKGWKGRGGSAANSDASTEQFMRDAVTALAAQGKARIDFLRLNGTAIAAAITLFSGGRAWFWKISYDENFARYSPGVQLAAGLTESLLNEKHLALMDSCAQADHPMIDHLWSRRIQLADWLVPLSGQASFGAGILFETARRFSIHALKAARDLVR